MSRKKKKPAQVKNPPQNDAVQQTTYGNSAAKKAAVLGTPRKSRLPIFAILACVFLIAGGALFLVRRNSTNGTAAQIQSSANSLGGQFTYPADLFDDGKARYFQYAGENVTIKYFILKSSDGVIRSAFDACDVCWPAGKGYYQDGDDMVCRNCGRRFASILVNEVKGGCNPAPLQRAFQDQKVIIRVNDILEGKQYFDFSRKAYP